MRLIKPLLTFFIAAALTFNLSAQCNFAATGAYGSGIAPTGCSPVTLTTCAFYTEYSTVTNLTAGVTYTFTASATPSVSGPFTFGIYNSNSIGSAPVAWITAAAYPLVITYTPAVTGSYYTSCFYGGASCTQTATVCHTYTVSCASCGQPNPVGTQPSIAPVAQNSINNQVLRMDVAACSASTVSAVNVSTSGSTNPATDIANAKLYYTTSTTFSTSVQFGSTINNPNGAMVFSGTANLAAGSTGYFWLTYDLTPGATIGDVIDGAGTTVTLNGTPLNVVPSNPAGTRAIQGLPSNDDCSAAINIPVNAGNQCATSLIGNTYFATQSVETAPTCGATGINDDVWYKFTATASTHFLGANYFDNSIVTQVYSGSCGSLVAVSCKTSSYGNANQLLTGLTVGNTYYVRVFSTVATVGTYSTFDICISTPTVPSNDNCATAAVLPCGGTVTGNNSMAGNEVLPPVTCGTTSALSYGVWYTITPPSSGSVTIDACGSKFDNYLRVYSGTCGSFTCVTSADGGCTSVPSHSDAKLTFTAVGGTTYYILFTSYSTTQFGDFTITSTCPLACTDAPSNLAASNVTSDGATVSWTASSPAPVNGYQYYYSTSSTAPGANTPPTGTTSNTYVTLAGLNSNTTYYFWVRAYCYAGDASSWIALPTFQTLIPSNCVVTITANPSTVCQGGTINFSTNNTWVSWSWAGPNGWTSSSSNPSLTNAQPNQSGTYSVTVTDANQCTAVDVETVTINPTPIATASATPARLCAGATIQLNATGGTSYSWSGPGAFTSNLQNPTRVNALTSYSGVYTVTVTSAGCTATATVSVIVDPKPSATASISPNPVCDGALATFTAGGGVAYKWTGPGGFTTDQKSFGRHMTPSMAGTYYVTVTSAAGCSATASASVSVAAAPNATASITPNVTCSGGTVQFQAAGGTTYQWKGPLGFNSTLPNPVINNVQTYHSGEYAVVVSNAAGCTKVIYLTLKVSQTPAGTIGYDVTSTCTGDTLKLYATGGSSYSWSGPGGFTSTQQNPIRLNSNSGFSGVYTVVITNIAGCSVTLSQNITIRPLPTITAFTTTPEVCEGGTALLFANGGVSYSWSGPYGYSSNFQNPIITNIPMYMSGKYAVKGYNEYGCSSTASVLITVQTVNAVANATPNPVPSNGTLYLTASGGTNYQWTGPNGFHTTQQNPIITKFQKTNAGLYSVIVSSSAGCQDTKIILVNIQGTGFGANAEYRMEGIYRQVYPNPSSSVIRIADDFQGEFAYKIISSNGTIPMQGKASVGDNISIQNLPAGSYYIQWNYTANDKQQSFISQFIKTN